MIIGIQFYIEMGTQLDHYFCKTFNKHFSFLALLGVRRIASTPSNFNGLKREREREWVRERERERESVCMFVYVSVCVGVLIGGWLRKRRKEKGREWERAKKVSQFIVTSYFFNTIGVDSIWCSLISSVCVCLCVCVCVCVCECECVWWREKLFDCPSRRE